MDLRKKNSPPLCIRQKLLLRKLNDFYNEPSNLEQLIPLLTGQSKISLRIIDWFVTNYSKKNNIIISKNSRLCNNDKIDLIKSISKTKKNKNDDVNIFLNYKSQLKAYSKKQFDPFCRRERITYFYDDDKHIITTIGQLNFFRWAIENNIIDYISNNLKKIEFDMNTNIKSNNKKSKKKGDICSETKKRKKRRELSVAATRTLNKHSMPIILDFD